MASEFHLKAEYLLILEALDQGVIPSDDAVSELVEMGILKRSARGLEMTIAARSKLANLRAEATAAEVTLYSGDVSDWSEAQPQDR